jgi:hypothetical protein
MDPRAKHVKTIHVHTRLHGSVSEAFGASQEWSGGFGKSTIHRYRATAEEGESLWIV